MSQNCTNGSQGSGFLLELADVLNRKEPPGDRDYLRVVKRAINLLNDENESRRPRDSRGRPGGVVKLIPGVPTLLIPDLHARTDFLYSVFAATIDGALPVAEQLSRGELQVVCVGDAFHSERRGASRWQAAFKEFQEGWKKHKQMDGEMRDSLGVMEMVMLAKLAFPLQFHFLKGNHENISNESGQGNHGFRKYAYEGPMVADYVSRFYGEEFLGTYYSYEKSFPLLCIGDGFLVSHAEPATFYEESRVINHREDPEVIEGLTWTDNDAAEKGSVDRMLTAYLGSTTGTVYFGGHRPVGSLYNLRAENKFVQFHNPERFIVVRIIDGPSFDVDRDVIEIADYSGGPAAAR